MKKLFYIIVAVFTLSVLLSFIACSKNSTSSTDDTQNTSETTLVYVTVAGHIEDGKYYADCNEYPKYREGLLKFADILKSYQIPFNLQIDYELFKGALDCETPEMKSQTGGTNVIDYLTNHYDIRIDPHQGGGWEEGAENYADVRFIGGLVTSKITDTAGGIVWDQQEQFERFNNGETGLLYPDFVWFPEILTLGVHTNHHLGNFALDDLTSGVWKPKGFGDNFLIHDGNNRMIYIGPGYQHSDWFENKDFHFKQAVDYVKVLVNYLEQGKINSGKIYTTTLAVPQKIIFNEEYHSKLKEQFDELASLVEQGKVVYAYYGEVVKIWREDYNSEPNLLTFDSISPDDYTIDGN